MNEAVARVGRDGELRTEELLSDLADRRNGPTVIHDLTIPIPGFKANIDHAVVAGRNVVLIDTKVWKPGRYWTLGGKTRRGTARVPHVDKANPRFGQDAVARYLSGRGIAFSMASPQIAVWSSSKRAPVKLFFVQIPGASVFPAAGLLRNVRRAVGTEPADPAIVAALSELAAGHGNRPTATIAPRRRSSKLYADAGAPLAPVGQAVPVPAAVPVAAILPVAAQVRNDSWF